MANQKLDGNVLTNTFAQVKQQIERTTDLNNLLKDNRFIEQLKNLQPTEQFKIFTQYQDKFNKISQDPGSAITKWIQDMTKNLPNLNTAQETVKDGLQQEQNIIHNIKNSLN